MPVRMQQRKGTAAEWLAAEPVILAIGEIGYETDTGYFKVGNGTSTWTQLEYFKSENDLGIGQEIQEAVTALETSLTTYIDQKDGETLAAAELAAQAYADAQDADILAQAGAFTAQEVNAGVLAANQYTDSQIAVVTDEYQNYTNAAVTAESSARTDAINAAISAEVADRDLAISDAVNLAIQQEQSDRDDAIQLAIAQEALDRNASIEFAVSQEAILRDTAIDTAITASEAATALLIESEISTERALINIEIANAVAAEAADRDLAIDTAIAASESATQILIDDAVGDAASDATLKANQAEANANAYTETALSTHNLDTTNVHGIADTAELATKTYADSAVDTHNSDTTNVHGIADTAALATKTYVDDAVVVHNVDTTNVHGIADTSVLETQSGAQTKANAAYSTAVTYTDTQVGLTLQSANAYTDQAELDANTYTDNEIAAALITAQGYATDAETNANAYSDGLAANYEPAGVVETHNSLPTLVHGVPADSSVVGTGMTQELTNKTLGSGTILSSNLNANNNTIINLAQPTQPSQAATKAYVDAVAEGLYIHEAVATATTANIDLATQLEAGDVIDGLTLEASMRVMVKNQTLPAENGIYVVQATGPAVRASDFDTSNEIRSGDFVYVRNGTINQGTSWVQVNSINDVDIDPINFIQFAGPGTITEGYGINVFGNQVSIDDTVVATRSWVADEVANASVDALSLAGTTLNPDIKTSSLESLGTLSSLTVGGATDLQGAVSVSGATTFTGAVNVPVPTAPTHATTKEYIDTLLNQSFVEIRTLDDLSNFFDGYTQRFLPTYQGVTVPVKHPFNLLLTIDGIIQSVGSPDYVWQSVLPRVGFDIDYEGYIKFPEPIPPGSSFDARILVGSEETKQTKVYPFKAADILLGGY